MMMIWDSPTIPILCASSMLLTVSAYLSIKKYRQSGDGSDLTSGVFMAISASFMWMSTIALTAVYFGAPQIPSIVIFIPLLTNAMMLWLASSITNLHQSNKKLSQEDPQNIAINLDPIPSRDLPENNQDQKYNFNISKKQNYIHYAFTLISTISSTAALISFTTPLGLPLLSVYLALLTCQTIWSYFLTKEMKIKVKSCLWLGKREIGVPPQQQRSNDTQILPENLHPQQFVGRGS